MIDQGDRAVIFERIAYRPFRPRVARLKGRVPVSRSGAIIHPVWLSRSLYWHEWVIVRSLAVAFLSFLRRGAHAVTDPRPLGIIHSLWSAGYYHWVTESLPRALEIRRRYPDAIPILPKDHYAGYAAALTALGFDDVRWFPQSSNALIHSPVVSECPPRFGTTDPALLRDVRDAISAHYRLKATKEPHRIVYVSRARARGRRVRNEAQLTAMLQSLGAEVVHFEDLDFAAQVRLMGETRLLVSIHGAGLTNMMWMPPGGRVIELLPVRNGWFDWNSVRRSFRHDACYVRLAEALGHRHRALLGMAHHARFGGTWNADLTVDAEALRTAVVEMSA